MTTIPITTRTMMTSTMTAIIPPKTAPKMVAVLSLPDDEGSVAPWEAVTSVPISAGVVGLVMGDSVIGGCVTISHVKESKILVIAISFMYMYTCVYKDAKNEHNTVYHYQCYTSLPSSQFDKSNFQVQHTFREGTHSDKQLHVGSLFSIKHAYF